MNHSSSLFLHCRYDHCFQNSTHHLHHGFHQNPNPHPPNCFSLAAILVVVAKPILLVRYLFLYLVLFLHLSFLIQSLF
jgi:hypothetical protein